VDSQFEAYRRQYEDTILHLYELEEPYLVGTGIPVDTDITGQTKVYSRIGKLTAQDKTGRNEIANLTEPTFTARHLRVATKYVASPIDKEDLEKMVGNPKDDIYRETVNAIREAQAQIAMAGFFDTVITGEAGGSTSSFAAGNQIAVNFSTGPFGQNSGASNVGLNIDKLMQVRNLLNQSGDVRVNTSDMTSLNIAVSEEDVQQLLASKVGTDNYPLIERFNSLQSNLGSAAENMIDGRFKWFGFTFHVLPQTYFNLDGSGYRRIPVWIKDGMVYGMKQNVATEIVSLPNTVESIKVQALTRGGTLRKHDSKVYEIKVTA